jgi:hypothetical protein
MENTKYKIKRIEVNWYADKEGEHCLTYDTTLNAKSIEERDGYMFVEMADELHRIPLSAVNITYFEIPEETN